MKITGELRKAINAAVRDNTRGTSPGARVGFRITADGASTANCLLWPNDSDLFDYRPLSDVREIDDSPDHPGCAELDLYVDTGRGWNRELETNVGILIRDGRVIFASGDTSTIRKSKASLGFPIVPWDHA